MRTQTSDNVKIGNIRYFTEFKGVAPISVYVISGEKGDMLIDTGFSTTTQALVRWISEKGYRIMVSAGFDGNVRK